MLDPIYHTRLKLVKNHIFCRENVKILSAFTQRYNIGIKHVFLCINICLTPGVVLASLDNRANMG